MFFFVESIISTKFSLKCFKDKFFFSVYSIRVFPDYFKFGSASAAYQIEGAWNLDGKSPSIWDTYVHENPHLVKNSSTGDIASDSYNFYRKDVLALKSVGVSFKQIENFIKFNQFNFYRFSISWSRILPDGIPTKINKLGIDYYNKLIDELILNGIEPMVTMCHWDIPQVLEDQGGFLNSSFQYWFKDYSRILFQNFGDRIKTWIPLNEPSIMCAFGYGLGLFAPNIYEAGTSDYLCGHNSILAHAQAYHLYKNEFFQKQGGKIGTSFNGGEAGLHEDENGIDPENYAAANRSMQWEIGLNAHPLFIGDYPKIVKERVARFSAEEGFTKSRLPEFTKEELEFVKGTSDFFGLNYYTSTVTKNDNTLYSNISMGKDCACLQYKKKEWPKAKSIWLYSHPEGLTNTLR